jgi:hypothetical protein
MASVAITVFFVDAVFRYTILSPEVGLSLAIILLFEGDASVPAV